MNADAKDTKELYPVVRTGMPVEIFCSGIGSASLMQDKLDQTKINIDISGIRQELLKIGADTISLTAQMRYADTVRRQVSQTIELVDGTDVYQAELENFGKHYVTLTYKGGGKTIAVSKEAVVGIAAQEYNIAYLNATFPVVLFTLSLWENENCITKGAQGNPIPTFCVFERAYSWDWEKLPENVHRLPYADDICYEGRNSNNWLENRKNAAAYIKELYEISPDARFHLYTVDNYPEHIPMLLDANQIPKSQYDVVLLSDGVGTYSIFNRVFQDDADGSKYRGLCTKWEECGRKSAKEGKYAAIEDGEWGLQEYASVAAKEDNVYWWVARTNGTFQIENAQLLEQVVSTCTVKSVSKMLEDMKDIGKTEELKALYHFNNEMFTDARTSNKSVMLFLGTDASVEQGFEDYAHLMMNYYGNRFQYYYKAHPGTPTALYPDKISQLEKLGITDVDSSIPAELVLFFFPDIYMCGYPSSTYLSVETEKMACGLFGKTKEEAKQLEYWRMMDFFAAPVDIQHPKYGSFCKEQGHPYYALEFNDTSKYDCAIYDAVIDRLTFYKKVGNGYEIVERENAEEQTADEVSLEKGKRFSVNGHMYQVTKSGTSAEATFLNTKSKAAKVNIPATVKKDGVVYKVTAIADRAMEANTKVTAVTIGDHVASIGDKAFAGCTALKKVKAGTGLKEIGKAVFSGNKKLTLLVIDSKNLTKVGKNALNNTKLAIKIKVPGEKISSYKKLFRGKGQDIPLIFREY
ncbi:MAG: leucine-rich repeat domain-containing protein [Eubacterium sp.]|nr:leucine-rich repeat domain-containing protein [Eubacterium sp.]